MVNILSYYIVVIRSLFIRYTEPGSMNLLLLSTTTIYPKIKLIIYILYIHFISVTLFFERPLGEPPDHQVCILVYSTVVSGHPRRGSGPVRLYVLIHTSTLLCNIVYC